MLQAQESAVCSCLSAASSGGPGGGGWLEWCQEVDAAEGRGALEGSAHSRSTLATGLRRQPDSLSAPEGKNQSQRGAEAFPRAHS